MSAVVEVPSTAARRGGVRALWAGNPGAVVQRGLIAARSSSWAVVLSGFFEPVFYLASMGIGLGALIGDVETTQGASVSYAAFIAPALLAVSAMNGAIYDSTWNVFFKLNYGKLYEGMLATSLGPLDVALGEILYALLRGLAYATGFMIIMQVLGLNLAWTAVLALPAVVLIAFGFASLGMAVTSYMKTFQQMDWINFVLLPMFLFSATFYPITVYPGWVQQIVMALPLWHGVELIRGLTTGILSVDMLWHVLYYLVMIAIGLVFTTKRLRALFLD
ncbi:MULTISPECIES: ABC transporter permease [Microbacterium]|uniref:Transport permease protein n=1 Tax=Microbacterium hominis TaxID=162426 RepID=A0A134DDW6_9MICO|nr:MULTISPECIES: ABC transporter permease [Microbacterium]AUG30484.1 ABC transporter [Microbacterium hominis]KXC04732.1 ABC transporter [Microbacterium hominis]QOC26246.1 ABC transporter permease [Microbacterium hominis]QOC30201.1 ABC transporter permease [Microbacterium hominis]QYF97448.1 ABC transporter permease [Microbacterium sp. PAMC21962]